MIPKNIPFIADDLFVSNKEVKVIKKKFLEGITFFLKNDIVHLQKIISITFKGWT